MNRHKTIIQKRENMLKYCIISMKYKMYLSVKGKKFAIRNAGVVVFCKIKNSRLDEKLLMQRLSKYDFKYVEYQNFFRVNRWPDIFISHRKRRQFLC